MTYLTNEFHEMIDQATAYLRTNKEQFIYLLVYDADTITNSNGTLAGKEVLCIPSSNEEETNKFVDCAMKNNHDDDSRRKNQMEDDINSITSQILKIAVENLEYEQQAISPLESVTFNQAGISRTCIKGYYKFTPPVMK